MILKYLFSVLMKYKDYKENFKLKRNKLKNINNIYYKVGENKNNYKQNFRKLRDSRARKRFIKIKLSKIIMKKIFKTF